MEDPNLSSPIALSGSGSVAAAAAAEEGFLVPDPNFHSGSASGSLQNDGVLSGGAGDSGSGNSSDAEFGFQRPGFGQDHIAGTVSRFERHVFLCYKTPQLWPSHIEAPEFDRLPRLLAAALLARKPDMKRKTRLTICEGEDSTDSSNGDILIFPDMVRYRRLTHFDVDNFVEEALVKETEWLPGAAEALSGSYIFVCAHGSRDRRCGVCGPPIIRKFKEEIKSRDLQGQVFVNPCSHIGGHKYAGNVIIFSSDADGKVTGHWYGYVSPGDVPVLLEQHIGKGEIVEHLWRGQMGLSEEEQRNAHDIRLKPNGETEKENTAEEVTETGDADVNGCAIENVGCCQGVGKSNCCQNLVPEQNMKNDGTSEPIAQEAEEEKNIKEKKTYARKACVMPTWFESWECEDMYAALAVVAAVVSVGIAYGCYKQLK